MLIETKMGGRIGDKVRVDLTGTFGVPGEDNNKELMHADPI